MKKFIFALAVASVAAVPGVASAATIFEGTKYALPIGGTAPTGFTGAECALVSENVKLGVSENVVGGFACDETNNLVQVAACHSGGSRSTGGACSTDADPTTDGIQLIPGCADETGNSTIPSFNSFSLSSAGGVMNEVPLGARCTSTTLGGITWVQ